VISNNAAYGIRCNDGYSALYISNCTVENNGSYPLRVWGNYVDNITGNMVFNGNASEAVYVDGDNLNTSTWLDHGVPYIIGSNLTVLNANTLTINPGCELKFGSGIQLTINGTLMADGDPGNRILFTSAETSPTPGYWYGIYFSGSDPTSVLDNCDILYAGSGGTGNSNIRMHNNSVVTITESQVAHSGGSGIYLSDQNMTASSLSISGSVISNNAAYGIRCNDGYSNLYISDCTLENNGSYPLRLWGNFVDNITGNMVFNGNTPDAIYVDGDNLYTSTWLDHALPYIIGGNLTVVNGNSLNLSPGCELRFNSAIGMTVQGTLVANGTTAGHIIFTSSQQVPTPGYWNYLNFSGTDPGTILNFCDITYGGSSNGQVYVRASGSNIQVKNSTIAYSGTAGIYINDQNTSQSHVSLQNCHIENNATYGIYSNYSGQHTLDNCSISGNGTGFYSNSNTHRLTYNNSIVNNSNYGIQLAGSSSLLFGDNLNRWNDVYGNGLYNIYNGTANINARFIYWGSTDSTTIAGTIYDHHDSGALGYVYFNPWTNAAHDSLFPQSYFLVDLKVFLEGPFSGSAMNTSINGVLPLGNPFHPTLPYFGNPIPDWYYPGTESVSSIPDANIVDWVLVDLRDAVSVSQAIPANSVAKQAGFLKSDGTVVGLDGASRLWFNKIINNNLYIVVWQRNHLGVLSSDEVPRTGSVYAWDFTSAAGQAYGGSNAHKEIAAGVWGMISGDGDGNGQVTNADKNEVWRIQSGGSGYKEGDFNLSGQVDNNDKIECWGPNSGAGSQVPE